MNWNYMVTQYDLIHLGEGHAVMCETLDEAKDVCFNWAAEGGSDFCLVIWDLLTRKAVLEYRLPVPEYQFFEVTDKKF